MEAGGRRITYLEEGDLEGREEGEEGVGEWDGVVDEDDGGVAGGGEAADEDAVDGGGGVLEGVENELDVGRLPDLVLHLAGH